MHEETYSEEDVKAICKIIENRFRALGRNCEVIFCDDGVSIAPPAWPGDSFGPDLFTALRDAETVK